MDGGHDAHDDAEESECQTGRAESGRSGSRKVGMMYPSLRTPGIAACEVGGFDVVQPINIRNNSLVTHLCMYIQGITTLA
jgi:hypothetical protein